MLSLGLVLLASIFILLFIGVPIGFTLGVSSMIGLIFFMHIPLEIMVQKLFAGIDSFPLMAIPFFFLAGNLMTNGGISKRLVNFSNTLVGSFQGGLGFVAILGSCFFAAISGSGPATTAAIGSILVPTMVEKGYNRGSSLALIASAGTIGVVIPPSIPMIVFGVTAGVSISDMFLAGFLPGFLMAVALGIVWVYVAKKDGLVAGEKSNLSAVWASFRDAVWGLIMPLIILGGIYGGIFTPTEAAVVAVFYGVIVGKYVYKELKWSDLPRILCVSAVSTAGVMIVVAAAILLGWVLTTSQIPQLLAANILGTISSKWVILLILNITFLIAGCFLDTTASIVLFTPILLPTLIAFDIEPIFAGIIMVVNLAIGMITPPVGINLFVASNIGEIKFETVMKAAIPFLIVLIISLLTLTYIPNIIMFLPSL